MDVTPAPGFKRRPAASSSPHGVTEIAKSPPPFSPSPSSPSSDPSSPFSTSSSPSAMMTGYHNDVKGHCQWAGVARVSSTSASLTAQSLSTPPPNTTSSNPSFLLRSAQLGEDGQRESVEKETYDPFHPTEGEREGREEEEGEKYDPFDPTGSPASDAGEEKGMEERGDGGNMVRGLKRKAEGRDDEEKEKAPPDSTDTLPVLPVSPLMTQLPLRRKLKRNATRTGRQRERADSDHSEIEEGEIVGAADRAGGSKRAAGGILPLTPSGCFFGAKPERILRVLDGDNFVSVRTEGDWTAVVQPEDEPVVVGDLRSKLVSRRKERFRTCPASSSLSPQPLPLPSLTPSSPPSSPLLLPVEQGNKSHMSSKSSKDRDRHKRKDEKAVEKEERRKKRRKEKEKEGSRERSREREQERKTGNKVKGRRRSSRSNSRKRKKRRQSSPEASRSHNSSGRAIHSRRSFSSLSEERHWERERDRVKDRDGDRERDRDRDRERKRDKDRDKDGDQYRTSIRRRDDRDGDSSHRKKEREREGRQQSSSRERGSSKRSKRSRERREDNGETQHDMERERQRDGRPVVPPSIQDLNCSDLFAIKRTITVTTTTTTTTLPGSPTFAPASPRSPMQDSDKPHKRKKKRKQREAKDSRSCRSRSRSLSPLRYHSYESDHYSDKLEIDMLSLDGEALDSDYPSLEDTPPTALPPEPHVPRPKTKATPKTVRHHPKKKSHTLKKMGQSESSSSSSITTKSKGFSSLSPTSASAPTPISTALPLTKQTRKFGKDKELEKGSRRESGRSSKSKKESGGCRKGKLQSKVSVLVREGVSSTTGASVGSGKRGMELLGPGGGAGGSVVGGSIAVVFRRDNESRSPFLKPCLEPLSVGGRSKDLGKVGKGISLSAPSSSLTSRATFKSKKAKPSSTTSTSSSASSPSSSLVTKRRRRPGKKTREKGGAVGLMDGDGCQSKATSEGLGGASSEIQSGVGGGSKSLSPHTGQAGPVPCSSSSYSTGAIPPSSSPPHTSPPSMAPLRDTRESSPDSQTVDSSCKTPEPSFLAEDCPTQTSPTLPLSSPASLSTPQGTGLTIALPTPSVKPLPPDDAPKSLASPPCSSSSSGCGLPALSLPLSSSDPSSSSSSSVSSSSASKPPPPPPPPPAGPVLPWSLQTGVDCTAGGVLACELLPYMD